MASVLSLMPLVLTLTLITSLPAPAHQNDLLGLKIVLPNRQNASDPAFSPDGINIAYVVTQGDSSQLWVTRVDGRRSRQVSSGQGRALEPAFSPSGSLLAYVWETGNDSRLMLAEVQTGISRSVSGGAKVGSFGWNANSSMLVYDDTITGRLRIFRLAEGRTQEVPLNMTAKCPIFGSDDNQIIFSGLESSHYTIWSLDLTSGRIKRLSWGTGDQLWPQLDPAKRRVLYVQFDYGRASLWVSDINGTWNQILFQTPSLEIPGTARSYQLPYILPELDVTTLPRWSPDGKYLLFLTASSNNGSNLNMATLNVTIKNEFPYGNPYYQIDLYGPVEQVKMHVEAFSWSPDGKSIALSVNYGTTNELVLLQIEPSRVKPIVGYGSP